MTRTLFRPPTVVFVALVIALSACEAQKSSNPLSPNIAGPIAGVNITAPGVTYPANGIEVVNTSPVRLTFRNATSNSPRPFWYVVELASDTSFSSPLYTNPKVTPNDGEETTVVVDGTLAAERTYYWRVKAADGANESSYSDPATFELVVPVVIGTPAPIDPVGGEPVGTNTPTLVVNNGPVQGRAGNVTYYFYVSRNASFTDVIAEMAAGRSGGATTSAKTGPLPMGALLYWRVIAGNGILFAAPSAAGSFRTPSPPTPGPGGPGGPIPTGGPCNASTPLTIVECERAKYGFMSSGQIVDFLISTTRSLNRNGIAGGPFGILRKGGGHNCNGYSCDIVCSGSGGGQRQWDVLSDAEGAQAPVWRQVTGPIRSDVCEVR
jgi:hypothetical protein